MATKKKTEKTIKKKIAKKDEKFKINMSFEDAIALSIKTKMPKEKKK